MVVSAVSTIELTTVAAGVVVVGCAAYAVMAYNRLHEDGEPSRAEGAT